jgi:hypothetical protein
MTSQPKRRAEFALFSGDQLMGQALTVTCKLADCGYDDCRRRPRNSFSLAKISTGWFLVASRLIEESPPSQAIDAPGEE